MPAQGRPRAAAPPAAAVLAAAFAILLAAAPGEALVLTARGGGEAAAHARGDCIDGVTRALESAAAGEAALGACGDSSDPAAPAPAAWWCRRFASSLLVKKGSLPAALQVVGAKQKVIRDAAAELCDGLLLPGTSQAGTSLASLRVTAPSKQSAAPAVVIAAKAEGDPFVASCVRYASAAEATSAGQVQKDCEARLGESDVGGFCKGYADLLRRGAGVAELRDFCAAQFRFMHGSSAAAASAAAAATVAAAPAATAPPAAATAAAAAATPNPAVAAATAPPPAAASGNISAASVHQGPTNSSGGSDDAAQDCRVRLAGIASLGLAQAEASQVLLADCMQRMGEGKAAPCQEIVRRFEQKLPAAKVCEPVTLLDAGAPTVEEMMSVCRSISKQTLTLGLKARALQLAVSDLCMARLKEIGPELAEPKVQLGCKLMGQKLDEASKRANGGLDVEAFCVALAGPKAAAVAAALATAAAAERRSVLAPMILAAGTSSRVSMGAAEGPVVAPAAPAADAAAAPAAPSVLDASAVNPHGTIRLPELSAEGPLPEAGNSPVEAVLAVAAPVSPPAAPPDAAKLAEVPTAAPAMALAAPAAPPTAPAAQQAPPEAPPAAPAAPPVAPPAAPPAAAPVALEASPPPAAPIMLKQAAPQDGAASTEDFLSSFLRSYDVAPSAALAFGGGAPPAQASAPASAPSWPLASLAFGNSATPPLAAAASFVEERHAAGPPRRPAALTPAPAAVKARALAEAKRVPAPPQRAVVTAFLARSAVGGAARHTSSHIGVAASPGMAAAAPRPLAPEGEEPDMFAERRDRPSGESAEGGDIDSLLGAFLTN